MNIFKKVSAFFQFIFSIFQWLQFIKLIHDLKKAVQTAIAKIPDFKHGAVQFLFVPNCEKANRMMFGIGMDCERKFIFPARPGYGHTRPAGYRGNREKECDCSGYAALKIQGAAFAYKNHMGNRSQDMSTTYLTWGRENDPGAVCYALFDYKSKPFMRLYVGVSGADGNEDQECAANARPVIVKWGLKRHLNIGLTQRHQW